MQSVLKLFSFAAVSTDEIELKQQFAQHISQYGISYGTQEEFNFRMSLYAEKDAEIKAINAREPNFTVGHNFMSTWTSAEFQKIQGKIPQTDTVNENYLSLEPSNSDSKDWRSEGAINAVKSVGSCGANSYFSVTTTVESDHFIKTGELLSLSE